MNERRTFHNVFLNKGQTKEKKKKKGEMKKQRFGGEEKEEGGDEEAGGYHYHSEVEKIFEGDFYNKKGRMKSLRGFIREENLGD